MSDRGASHSRDKCLFFRLVIIFWHLGMNASREERGGRQNQIAGCSATPIFSMPPQISTAAVVSQPFKRAQFGLFQGKTKQYGNNVPHSKHKTRRTWLPNVQRKRLHSEALNEKVRVKVTTRALKTIKKVRFFHASINNH